MKENFWSGNSYLVCFESVYHGVPVLVCVQHQEGGGEGALGLVYQPVLV